MGKARNILAFETEASRALKNQRGIGNQAPEMFGGPFTNNPDPLQPAVKHLPITGGILQGPLAFKDSKETITTGVIDVGRTKSGFAGLIVVQAETGTTDTLDTIKNPSFPGQKLILQADTGDTITISTAGNIDTADGSSFSLNAEKTLEVVFSQLSGKWEFIQGGGIAGAGSQTPWTQDIDADGFDLKDLSNLEFRVTTGTPAAGTASIHVDSGGNLNLNVADTDVHLIRANNVTEYQFSQTAADWQQNDLISLNELRFTNGATITNPTLVGIGADASGDMLLNTNTADSYLFHFGGNEIIEFSTTQAILKTASGLTTNVLFFQNTDTTPADNDIPGTLRWSGFDDEGTGANGILIYGQIEVDQDDVTAGSIEGVLRISATVAGVNTVMMGFNDALSRGDVMCEVDFMPAGAGRDLGDATLEWDNLFINTINPATGGVITMASDVSMGGNNLDEGGVINLIEQAAADADVAGRGQIWVKTATPNQLFFTDDAGTDFQLGVGGVSFPVEPAITIDATWTGAENIDLSDGDGHVWKLTMTGNVTLTFSNYPTSGNQREWELEIIQDATGGRTLTLPSEVVDTVSIDTTALATTILTFRTNDGGTSVFVIAVRHGGSAAAGAHTPWTSDRDADGFDLVDLSNLEFRATTGAPAGTVPNIHSDATGDINLNVADGDRFEIRVNAIAEYFFNKDEVDWNANSLVDLKNLKFNNSGAVTAGTAMIFADATGDLTSNVASADTFFWEFQGVNNMSFNDTTGLDLFKHNVKDVSEINFDNNATAITTTLSAIKSDASGDLLISVATGDNHFIQYAGVSKYDFDVNRFQPFNDNDVDLGSSGTRFKEIHGLAFVLADKAADPTVTGEFIRNGTTVNLLTTIFTIFETNATPILDLERTDTGVAGNDAGLIEFIGESNTGVSRVYGNITVEMDGVLNTNENGKMKFAVIDAGVGPTTAMMIDSTVSPVALGMEDHPIVRTASILPNDDNDAEVGSASLGYQNFQGFNLLLRASTNVHGYIEETELSADPAAPAANKVRIFCKDNGSGKTQLMAIFNTGAAQQLAIQP